MSEINITLAIGFLKGVQNGVIAADLEIERLSKSVFDMAIQALQEKQEREWIPIREMLPEKSGYVNVTIRSDFGNFTEFCYYNEFIKNFSYVADGKDELNQAWEEEATNVISWMKLPLPYKEATK